MGHETFESSKRNMKMRQSATTARELAIAGRVAIASILIYFCWLAPAHDSFSLAVGRFIAAALVFSAIHVYCLPDSHSEGR